MRLSRPCWILLILMLTLSGCAGYSNKSVFPPRASIQQLSVQPDGSWKLQMRMQNFSEISMTFARVDAKVEVAGNPAGNVVVSPNLRIGPESADIAEVELRATSAAAQAVAALHGNGSVRYKLAGKIFMSEPAREYPFTFEGTLSPVPGLPNVLR